MDKIETVFSSTLIKEASPSCRVMMNNQNEVKEIGHKVGKDINGEEL